MDISAIDGEELKSVEFVEDYLQLRFGEPLLKLYDWPHILLTDSSVAFGEPEYRNALCAQIGETVERAILEEGDALTVEFAERHRLRSLPARRRCGQPGVRQLLSNRR